MIEMQWKNAQGLNLFAAHWPVNDARAVIALAHGQGEHILRFRHVAEWFNHHKFAVVGFDHQGYGKSEGNRGHVAGYEFFLDDIGLLLEKVKELYTNIPCFLYGHSMGGGIALNYVTRRHPDLAGLIATGPWIRLAFEAPAIKIMAGKMLRRIAPTFTLPTGLDPKSVSRDEAVVQAYIADPLIHNKLSAAAGIALLEGAEWLNKWAGEFKIPVLLLHGGDDKLTSAVATKDFANRVKGNVTHREWPGLFHEIHNEREKEDVFAYILQWMAQILH